MCILLWAHKVSIFDAPTNEASFIAQLQLAHFTPKKDPEEGHTIATPP